VLFIWNRLVASRVISDPGNKRRRSRHPGAMRSIEPGMTRFPNAQLRI
jgi:hypothetical protein